MKEKELFSVCWITCPIPHFLNKSFECTFRIKQGMVHIIIYNLAKENSFWGQTVCSASKSTNCPYVKFLCTQKMLCSGASASTFIDSIQNGGTTSRRRLSLLTSSLVCCNALADIYLTKPTKSDPQNIVALHQNIHNIPGTMGSLKVTKVH